MYQNIPTKVLTGVVRLSYCFLSTPAAPRNNPDGEKKYSVTLLIPKSDVATYNDIMSSIEAAKQIAITECWNGVCPPNTHIPLHDGDGVKDNGEPYGPECKGYWVVRANANLDHKPQVVGIDNPAVELDPRDVYSGMYARVTINFVGYSNSGNRGISCRLGNVLKISDGEPLSGGASAASDFAGITQAPMPAAPSYGATMPATPGAYGQAPTAQPAAPQIGAYGQTPAAPYPPQAAMQYPPQQPVTPPTAPAYSPQQPAANAWSAPNGIDPITGLPR